MDEEKYTITKMAQNVNLNNFVSYNFVTLPSEKEL